MNKSTTVADALYSSIAMIKSELERGIRIRHRNRQVVPRICAVAICHDDYYGYQSMSYSTAYSPQPCPCFRFQ